MKYIWLLFFAAVLHAADLPETRLDRARLLALDGKTTEAIAQLQALTADESLSVYLRREAAFAEARLHLDLNDSAAAAATLRRLFARDSAAGLSCVSRYTGFGTPRPARHDPDYGSIRYKLENIIIPKISFEETPFVTVMAFLEKRSAELDIEGEGVAISYLADRDFSPPTITLDFDNTPIGELIRYICQGCGLNYRILAGGVLIAPPQVPLQAIELRVFAVDAGVTNLPVKSSAAFADDDDADIEQTPIDPVDFFTRLGVDFPAGTGIIFLRRQGIMCIWNTPYNLRKVEETLCVLDTQPTQICGTATIVEVPHGKFAGVPPDQITPARILALPPEQRRIVVTWSNLALSGVPSSVGVVPETAGNTFRFTATTAPDGYTLDFDFHFADHAGPGATRIDSQATIWDGESLLWPLDPTPIGDRYLLIRPMLVNPANLPIRPTDFP